MDRKMVNFIKEQYPPGTRIRLNSMEDPYHPILPGTEGEVDFVDNEGQIFMKWDNGRTLPLIPGEDSFTVLPPKLTTLKLYMPLTADLYERNEYGEFDDSSTLLEGSELRGYQDQITAALVKNRMPEEAERGIMHWYDEADSVDRKVRSAVFIVEERDRQLWGVAECRVAGKLSDMTMLRSEAFRDMPAAGWRFEAAAVTTPQLEKARGYAQNWDEFKKAGIGLLLFGNVGTGKSYAAGCIANALIDRLESVLFVGMSDVVNRMQGNFGSDRDHYMKSLMRPDLLILDDLGAERNTSFGKERVFDVVDKRLLTGKPMIVTTNIPLSVMKQAVDLDDRRIYDRILEVCVPIMFDGDSFRKSTAADNLKTAARLLG